VGDIGLRDKVSNQTRRGNADDSPQHLLYDWGSDRLYEKRDFNKSDPIVMRKFASIFSVVFVSLMASSAVSLEDAKLIDIINDGGVDQLVIYSFPADIMTINALTGSDVVHSYQYQFVVKSLVGNKLVASIASELDEAPVSGGRVDFDIRWVFVFKKDTTKVFEANVSGSLRGAVRDGKAIKLSEKFQDNLKKLLLAPFVPLPVTP
jgi:hypothetical protein